MSATHRVNALRQKEHVSAHRLAVRFASAAWELRYAWTSCSTRLPNVDKLAKFLEMKERFPTSEMPRWSIATCYEDQEQYSEAISEFQDLVKIKPDYCVAFLHLGSCLMEEERFEEAIDALEKAHALAIAQGHDAPRMEAEMLLENAREELEDA